MSHYPPPNAARPHPQAFRVPRSLHGIMWAVVVLLAADVVAQIATFVAAGNRISVVQEFLDNGFLRDEDAASAADNAVGGVSGLALLLYLATAVVFIIWSYRFVDNVRSFGRQPESGPGWMIGGWFIPVANLFIPARTLLRADQHSDVAGPGKRWLVVVWAVFFALGNGGTVSTAFATDDVTAPDYLTNLKMSDRTDQIAAVLLAIAAVLAIVMVRMLTQRQGRALQQVAALQTPGGAYANAWPAPGMPVAQAPGTAPGFAPPTAWQPPPVSAPPSAPPAEWPTQGPQFGAPGTDAPPANVAPAPPTPPGSV